MLSNKLSVRFAVVFAAFAVAVFLTYREEFLGRWLKDLATLTASACLWTLERLNISAVQKGTVISHAGGFAYEIYYRCTGFLPACCLAVSILAYPGNWQRKLIGLALGIPLVFLLNLVRLVHLFVIGVSRPEWFEFVHGSAWEGAMILAVAGLWGAWREWVWAPSDPVKPKLALQLKGHATAGTCPDI